MQYNLLTFIVIQEPRIQELCYMLARNVLIFPISWKDRNV